MFIIIILIVIAAVVYLIMNSSAQNTTTPNITIPFVNPIPNLLLIKDNLQLFYTLNKMIDNADSQSRTTSNLTWNKDMKIITNPVDNDENKLAAQFRFFAEFWLNKLNINSGFTNVYDMSGNIGRYDFTRNNTIYVGKFNGVEWSWDTTNYCFNTVTSKSEDKCLGGWMFNKENGKCYPLLNSTSSCSNYQHATMKNYKQTDINNWMRNCNVLNSPNCKIPREGQLENPQQSPSSSTQPPGSFTQSPSTQLSALSFILFNV